MSPCGFTTKPVPLLAVVVSGRAALTLGASGTGSGMGFVS